MVSPDQLLATSNQNNVPWVGNGGPRAWPSCCETSGRGSPCLG